MINTVNIKEQQLKNGFLTVGSGSEVMLIMGSCRVAPYVGYMDKWNSQNGNRFTIHTLDCFNWNWNINDERVDYLETLNGMETYLPLIEMLSKVDYFIHEWYANAGMFNCDKSGVKNIYQFGLTPKVDICIPSWNDVFVLVNDILNFDTEVRKKALQDINVIGRLSKLTEHEILGISQKNLQKFYDVCKKSDLPEMASYFCLYLPTQRFFHSYNHITKYFTLKVFELINDKFLHLPITKEYWNEISKHDMYANSYTKLTQLDIDHYGFDWGEEVVPLFS